MMDGVGVPRRILIWVKADNYGRYGNVSGLQKAHDKFVHADVNMTWREFFRETFNVELDPRKHFVRRTANRTSNNKHNVNEQISVWLSGFKTTLHPYVVHVGEIKGVPMGIKRTLLQQRLTGKLSTARSTAGRIIRRPAKFLSLGINSNEPRPVGEIDRVTAQAANHVKKVGGGPLSSTFSTASAPLSTTSQQSNRIPMGRQEVKRTYCPSTFAVPLPSISSGSNGIATRGVEGHGVKANERMSTDNELEDESPVNSDDSTGQKKEAIQLSNPSSAPIVYFKATLVKNTMLKFRNSQLIKARDALRKLKQSRDKQNWTNYGMACPEAFIIVQSLFDV